MRSRRSVAPRPRRAAAPGPGAVRVLSRARHPNESGRGRVPNGSRSPLTRVSAWSGPARPRGTTRRPGGCNGNASASTLTAPSLGGRAATRRIAHRAPAGAGGRPGRARRHRGRPRLVQHRGGRRRPAGQVVCRPARPDTAGPPGRPSGRAPNAASRTASRPRRCPCAMAERERARRPPGPALGRPSVAARSVRGRRA